MNASAKIKSNQEKVFTAGDKGRCFCEKCDATVSVSYIQRDVHVPKLGMVKDLIVGCCDFCDDVIHLPQEAEKAIEVSQELHDQLGA